MKRFVLLALLAIAGCAKPCPPAPTSTGPRIVVDSGATVVMRVDSAIARRADSLAVLVDTLRARHREQLILLRLTDQQMKRYAAIVSRECLKPCTDQRRFLVGWTNRAFGNAYGAPLP